MIITVLVVFKYLINATLKLCNRAIYSQEANLYDIYIGLFVALFRCNVSLFGEAFCVVVSTYIARHFTQCAGVQFYIVLAPCLRNVRSHFAESRLSDVRSQMDVILGILMWCSEQKMPEFAIIE